MSIKNGRHVPTQWFSAPLGPRGRTGLRQSDTAEKSSRGHFRAAFSPTAAGCDVRYLRKKITRQTCGQQQHITEKSNLRCSRFSRFGTSHWETAKKSKFYFPQPSIQLNVNTIFISDTNWQAVQNDNQFGQNISGSFTFFGVTESRWVVLCWYMNTCTRRCVVTGRALDPLKASAHGGRVTGPSADKNNNIDK